MSNSATINVKFVKPEDLNLKRQKELQMKSQFLKQIGQLKTIGDTNDLLFKVEKWLDSRLSGKRSKSENYQKQEQAI